MPRYKSAEQIEVERRMREFICDAPNCGAEPGQHCHTRSGNLASTPHADRWEKATAAGRLPLRDTEPWLIGDSRG